MRSQRLSVHPVAGLGSRIETLGARARNWRVYAVRRIDYGQPVHLRAPYWSAAWPGRASFTLCGFAQPCIAPHKPLPLSTVHCLRGCSIVWPCSARYTQAPQHAFVRVGRRSVVVRSSSAWHNGQQRFGTGGTGEAGLRLWPRLLALVMRELYDASAYRLAGMASARRGCYSGTIDRSRPVAVTLQSSHAVRADAPLTMLQQRLLRLPTAILVQAVLDLRQPSRVLFQAPVKRR